MKIENLLNSYNGNITERDCCVVCHGKDELKTVIEWSRFNDKVIPDTLINHELPVGVFVSDKTLNFTNDWNLGVTFVTYGAIMDQFGAFAYNPGDTMAICGFDGNIFEVEVIKSINNEILVKFPSGGVQVVNTESK